MSWVDFHCHIDLYDSLGEVIREVESARVYTVAVTNVPSRFQVVNSKMAGFKYVRAALGLHPQLAFRHFHEVNLFRRLLPQTRYIGEVGLDGTERVGEIWERQRSVFECIIDWCAAAGDKIITVHSRRAERDVINIIGENFPGTVIMHWYSGGTRELERCIEQGFYFSVNPAMIRSRRGRLLIACIPKDRILTESDGPFVRIGKRPSRPLDVQFAVRGLASLWGVSVDEVRKLVLANFRKLLNHSG